MLVAILTTVAGVDAPILIPKREMLEDAETGFTNAPEEEEHDERSDANARREALCRAVIFA